MTEIVGPTKPKMFALWPLTENVCKTLRWKGSAGFRRRSQGWRGRDWGTLPLPSDSACRPATHQREAGLKTPGFSALPSSVHPQRPWRVGKTAANPHSEGVGDSHGDGKLGALSLSSGDHKILLDSQVIPREVNTQQ